MTGRGNGIISGMTVDDMEGVKNWKGNEAPRGSGTGRT